MAAFFAKKQEVLLKLHSSFGDRVHIPPFFCENNTRLRSGFGEEQACTAASREHAVTRLTGESKMLATGGATTCSLELIRAGRQHALAAMAHLGRP